MLHDPIPVLLLEFHLREPHIWQVNDASEAPLLTLLVLQDGVICASYTGCTRFGSGLVCCDCKDKLYGLLRSSTLDNTIECMSLVRLCQPSADTDDRETA
jgi:hypothetical protein